MAQLTGTFQGTSQSDSYLGEILNGEAVIIDDTLTAIAATDLVINSFCGNDVVEAIVDINRNPTDPIAAQGIGIENAMITMGRGEDTVTVSSAVISDLRVSQGTGTISESTGVLGSTIATGRGRDVVNISSLAVVVNDDPSNPFPEGLPSVFAKSFGVVDSTISLGSGKDEISIAADIPVARSRNDVGNAESRGVSNTTVSGGSGADSISITAQATANGQNDSVVSSYGVGFGSVINGGYGTDTITIDAETRADGNSLVVGLGEGSDVNGGAARDVITVSARKVGFGATTANIKGVLLGAVVNGGRGADAIEINSQGSVLGFGTLNVFGVEKANVNGGRGADTIAVNVSGSGGANTAYFGVFQANVAGGDGSDSILINVTGTTSDGTSVGVRQGTLEGGNGQDSFVVRGVNLDLNEAVIRGGNGADVFDTGIGTANISGDWGNDLIKLDFFDDTTMSIALLGRDSIQVTGTADKLGNSKTWEQTITNVEQYEVAGISYGAADVVKLLG